MKNNFNIYCDESCHLENDRQPIMVLGGIWCSKDVLYEYISDIKLIKEKYKARGELKWTKVSPSRESFFIEIVNYFFSKDGMNFRAVIVDNKSNLNHSFYNHGDHDSFYYKMYFYLLRNIIVPKYQYNIYLDIKDTRSQVRINKLREILGNNFYDFDKVIIQKIQHVRSKEIELLQLADFLIGAISYNKRGLTNNTVKNRIIKRIKELSHLNLLNTTPPWDEKFNLFFFSPRGNYV